MKRKLITIASIAAAAIMAFTPAAFASSENTCTKNDTTALLSQYTGSKFTVASGNDINLDIQSLLAMCKNGSIDSIAAGKLNTLFYKYNVYIDNTYYMNDYVAITKVTQAQTSQSKPIVKLTIVPTVKPTVAPTVVSPTKPTTVPTAVPSAKPTTAPTAIPSAKPTITPTAIPSLKPTTAPTAVPSLKPTIVPIAVPTTKPVVTQNSNNSSVSTLEKNMIDIVNQDRTNNGLSPLKINSELSTAARKHSSDMATNDFFSHTSPTNGGFSQRLSASGIATRGAGENIAHYNSIEKAQAALMSSEGHKANILGKSFTDVGIGIIWDSSANAYCITQWFARMG